MKISASIYSNKDKSIDELVDLLDAHQVDLLHIDCNDVPKVFDDIATIQANSQTPIDLHIISERPEQYYEAIERLAVDYVTFQLENVHQAWSLPQFRDSKVGLAIVSTTPLEAFKPYVDDIDFALMMTTTPGQSGGTFDRMNFKRIRQMRRDYPHLPIHVDGGVNAEVSFILRNLGVHACVSGSYLVNHNHLGEALMNLQHRPVDSHFKVEDIMVGFDRVPHVDLASASAQKVVQSMEDGKLGFTCFVESDMQLAGICSNADLRRAVLGQLKTGEELNMELLRNPKPITVYGDQTVTEMLDLVKRLPFIILFLPVINRQQQLIGAVLFNQLIKGEA